MRRRRSSAPTSHAAAAAVRREQRGPVEDYGIPDPLAADLAEIAKTLSGTSTSEARAPTLPFGGDKWGRDVLKKTIKGSEMSIFVGLAAAVLATFLGTVFGAFAGFYGGWVDDFFNWFYSVFTSIPVPAADPRGRRGAAAERHADDHPDPRPHRLDRHLPPDPRRVPEAQGARIRAGRRRDRRVERARACSCTSCPNVSHVVLVQLSIHVVRSSSPK